MARLRKFAAYRSVERPYTRFSKYRKHNFVRARPNCRVVRFDMGDVNKKYDVAVHLLSKSDLQIRDNAIEAARQSSNRVLEKNLGKKQYHYRVRIYPHHVLRENALASGAGADRMSTGMKHAFGKPIGIAARVKKGQPLFTVQCTRQALPHVRTALKRAAAKLPCSCTLQTENLTPVVKKSVQEKPAEPQAPKAEEQASAEAVNA